MQVKPLFEFIEDELSVLVGQAFEKAGYGAALGWVKKADRPDLCDYQCNGALQGAREYRKAPPVIAKDVVAYINKPDIFSEVSLAGGFINFKLCPEYLLKKMAAMFCPESYSYTTNPRRVVLDYGGPNVAKPLHVGHLRSAIIGETIKRMLRFSGDSVLGDIHLGDWGLQMGMVILGISELKPELAGLEDETREFDFSSLGISLDDLNEIYPQISRRCKEDKEMYSRAQQITTQLQNHHRGYYGLWQYITSISIHDLKASYAHLNIEFDLWLGESSVTEIIAPLVKRMQEEGHARESEGALIVECAQEGDSMEIPPLILLSSNGSALYSTTDLATLQYRMEHHHPDAVIYITDKRQEMHFTQVFRVAKSTGLVPAETLLQHVGFGTMNGEDGKPFKTRAGGVMKLQDLIDMVLAKAGEKIREQNPNSIDDHKLLGQLAAKIGIASLKYADLINKPSRDYIFNLDKFCSFEGKTGAYLLYANTRIKAIFRKVECENPGELRLLPPASEAERTLWLTILDFPARLSGSCKSLQPNFLAEYCYLVACAFNGFYKEHHIKSHPHQEQKESWLKLAWTTSQLLELCMQLLGIEPVEYM